jgi:glycosyltransferase involved in cell wall biosynthesis
MKPLFNNKLIRTSTIATSLNCLLQGQLSFLKERYHVMAVSGEDSHLQEVRVREGVETISIEMQRNISLSKDAKSLWQLYWLFKKEKPLIVHSITPKAGLLTMVSGYLAGVPIRVHTFTGLIFPSKSGFVKQLLILMDKILCRCATAIYPEGQGVKDDLIHYKITNKPLKVIANGNVNGIDIQHFNPDLFSKTENQLLKASLKISADDFVFIFVGRLVGDKGINELIVAFKKLSSEIKNVKLLLVGSFEELFDPLLPETKKEILTNDTIRFVGFQKDVRPYFAISDSLVFPSYREGFPNVVMQAGAMGLPIVATNINGCNEIIIEGENGILFPVKNSNAVYNAMKKILSEDEFRIKLKQNARNMIASRYEQQVVWEGVLEEYKRLEQELKEKK